MQNRKSGFWTFIFSLLPGAGEMYLGAIKKGLALMSGFFFWVFLTSLFNWEALGYFLPIIWFYSFFDVLNSKHYTVEELKESEDRFFGSITKFFGGTLKSQSFITVKRIGIAIIVLGILGLLEGALFPVLRTLLHNNVLYNILRYVPSVVVCILIILLGVHMLNSSKKTDFIEFKEIKDKPDDKQVAVPVDKKEEKQEDKKDIPEDTEDKQKVILEKNE